MSVYSKYPTTNFIMLASLQAPRVKMRVLVQIFSIGCRGLGNNQVQLSVSIIIVAGALLRSPAFARTLRLALILILIMYGVLRVCERIR